MNVTHLYCSLCGKEYKARKLVNLCICGKPLLVNYDLEKSSANFYSRITGRPRELVVALPQVLPVDNEANILSLGEGMTPLIKADRLAATLDYRTCSLRTKV
jgi:threonine synthase